MDYLFMSEEDRSAPKNPLMVMTAESEQNRYMRATGKKGLGEGKEMEWLIKDMHEEFKSLGYPGGGENPIILKSDGEASIVAVREALGRYHGGLATPETSPKAESAANGAAEEAGKTIRGMVKVYKDQIEDKANIKIESGDVIMQWLVRWAAIAYSKVKKGDDGEDCLQTAKRRNMQGGGSPDWRESILQETQRIRE